MGIHNKLSILVNDIFEAVIGTKLNIDRGNLSLFIIIKILIIYLLLTNIHFINGKIFIILLIQI